MTPPVLWTPPDALLQRATMARYMRERGFETYAELQRWSVEDLEGFWGSIWDRFGVGERGPTVLASREMPGAHVVPGHARSTTPSTRSAGAPTTRSRSSPAARTARTSSGPGASCAR